MRQTVIDDHQQMAAHRTSTRRLPINTQQLLRVRTIAAQGLSAAKSHQDSGFTHAKDGPHACRYTGKHRLQRAPASLASGASCPLARSSAKRHRLPQLLGWGRLRIAAKRRKTITLQAHAFACSGQLKTAQTTTAPRLGQTAHRGEKTQGNYPAGACLCLFRLS